MFDTISDKFLRPKRKVYDPISLGPQQFSLPPYNFYRQDFSLLNQRNLHLACSFFQIINPERQQYPTVIYLHSNGGSRIEGLDQMRFLGQLGIQTFLFDFAGSGMSQGDYVSLGYYESSDVQCVVNYLRSTGKTNEIALWGRSMGAVSAVIYASCDQTIKGLILDSPFANLMEMAIERTSVKTMIPEFILSPVFNLVQDRIKEKAGYDIEQLDLNKVIMKCRQPAIFLTSVEDFLVQSATVERLFQKYQGSKQILYMRGNHNQKRDINLVGQVCSQLASFFSVNKQQYQQQQQQQPQNLSVNRQQQQQPQNLQNLLTHNHYQLFQLNDSKLPAYFQPIVTQQRQPMTKQEIVQQIIIQQPKQLQSQKSAKQSLQQTVQYPQKFMTPSKVKHVSMKMPSPIKSQQIEFQLNFFIFFYLFQTIISKSYQKLFKNLEQKKSQDKFKRKKEKLKQQLNANTNSSCIISSQYIFEFY